MGAETFPFSGFEGGRARPCARDLNPSIAVDMRTIPRLVFEMILEVAMLDVKPGMESAFENDFDLATSIISGSEGYLSHELQRCVETPNRYALLVRWETLEAHTEGFLNRRNIRNGNVCSITTTTHFRPWSILRKFMKARMAPNR